MLCVLLARIARANSARARIPVNARLRGRAPPGEPPTHSTAEGLAIDAPSIMVYGWSPGRNRSATVEMISTPGAATIHLRAEITELREEQIYANRAVGSVGSPRRPELPLGAVFSGRRRRYLDNFRKGSRASEPPPRCCPPRRYTSAPPATAS